jgi:hypothetical protein
MDFYIQGNPVSNQEITFTAEPPTLVDTVEMNLQKLWPACTADNIHHATYQTVSFSDGWASAHWLMGDDPGTNQITAFGPGDLSVSASMQGITPDTDSWGDGSDHDYRPFAYGAAVSVWRENEEVDGEMIYRPIPWPLWMRVFKRVFDGGVWSVRPAEDTDDVTVIYEDASTDGRMAESIELIPDPSTTNILEISPKNGFALAYWAPKSYIGGDVARLYRTVTNGTYFPSEDVLIFGPGSRLLRYAPDPIWRTGPYCRRGTHHCF